MVRLLEEPVAAAIAFGLHEDDRERLVVVYDLGGGTLDVAVLRLERSSKTFLVMGTSGDPHLGGRELGLASTSFTMLFTFLFFSLFFSCCHRSLNH